MGAEIFEGHKAEQVHGAHVVVVSSAVRKRQSGNCRGAPPQNSVIPRAEMLAELMRLKYGIAVAGAHGKTTTTSMTASVLAAAGLDPTFVVGGRVNHIGSTARLGRGEYMVVEADESDRTFPVARSGGCRGDDHRPRASGHLQVPRGNSGNFHAVRQSRAVLRRRGALPGRAKRPGHHPNVKRPVITYGTSSQADLVISEIELLGLESTFRLTYRGDDLGKFHLNGPPGIHNVRNAAAAAAVALYLNVPADLIRAGLEEFAGVGRRFDVKGVINNITLIDDYGHHPAEIRATLEAARGCHFERILVLFQPHRYTRTQHLWDDFCRAFNQADMVVLMDIYAAGEQPIPGITGQALADAIRAAGHKNVVFHSSMQEGIEELLRAARPGDAILTIGAGNVSRAPGELAILLGARVSLHHAH